MNKEITLFDSKVITLLRMDPKSFGEISRLAEKFRFK